MNRHTAIGMTLFLLFCLVVAMGAPVMAESILHARSVVAEAHP